ncbi:hypothetical protein [Pseudomonas putida]|uniref:hypothetical protein n=1 Tax=Pseudomonas putida TaxID=303 RepID=UPI00235D58E3|nr:hypothetical protein [Pseudomonas putida]GLO27620.1 hypothetical protein PPUJ21368_54510 [Pseudomonas putida]HDS0972369.1 hypothetical protein [Pseudomonas putida]
MTIDKEKLKALADRVTTDRRFCGDECHSELASGVLALLEEIRRNETESAYVMAGSRTRAEIIDQLKAEYEALRLAALAAGEFIMHEAEVRGLLDDKGQVSHRHPRRQQAIARIEAALAKESSHD